MSLAATLITMVSGDRLGPVQAAYDLIAEHYAAHFRSTEPEQAVDLAMIDHFAKLLSGSRVVLDAGCGAGRMARYLADRGCHVQGIDLSPEMIRMAQRDHPHIPSSVSSITALPFGYDTFDGLFYWYSIIHLTDTDLGAALQEASRVLRHGGHILLAFQTGTGSREVGEGYSRRYGRDVTMIRFHRMPDAVTQLLRSSGFAEVCRLDRAPVVGLERDGQAVLIALRSER